MNDRTELIIRHQPSSGDNDDSTGFEWIGGADALLLNPGNLEPEDAPVDIFDRFVLQSGDPENDRCWQEIHACQWVGSEGLEQTAQMRDAWPDLEWVPLLQVYRPEMSYRFSGPAVGEGFSFYIPDTSVIKGWRVTDEDRNLTDALELARNLGFSEVWLHSLDAEEKGQGLDLDVLEKAVNTMPDLWISGGLSEVRHLSNLARWGGASCVVIDQAFAEMHGVEQLQQSLIPKTEGQVAPEINFG